MSFSGIMGRHVHFRVDGGNVYGLAMGHLYRCLRIAQYLKTRNCTCLFMTSGAMALQMIGQHGFRAIEIAEAMSGDQADRLVVEKAAQCNAVLFVDLPETPARLLKRAKDAGLVTAVYEDRCTPGISPDILFNPLPYPVDYGQLANGTRVFRGLDYLVINPDISKYDPHPFAPTIRRLFVNFGGADPCNLTSRVLKIILALKTGVDIFVLLGPAFRDPAQLHKLIAERDTDKTVTVFKASRSPADIQRQCDAAVCAGGNTVYELCSLGLPCLVFPTIKHEQELSIHLDRLGWVDGLNQDANQVPDVTLSDRIAHFLSHRDLRQRLHTNAGELDLVRGRERVGQVLIDMIEKAT